MKVLKNKLVVFIFVLFASILPLLSLSKASAVAVLDCSGPAAQSVACQGKDDKLFGPNSIWTRITNTLIFVLGAIAVLMIIVGGMRYSLSNGDQSQITLGKNTIIYSVVGLVLALMAGGIVNFVLVNI